MAGSLLRRLVKSKPGQNAGGPRFTAIGVNINKPCMDLPDTVSIGGGVRFAQQLITFQISCQNRIKKADVAGRCFLIDTADAKIRRHFDLPAIDFPFVADQSE